MNSFNRYNAEVDSIAKQYNRPHGCRSQTWHEDNGLGSTTGLRRGVLGSTRKTHTFRLIIHWRTSKIITSECKLMLADKDIDAAMNLLGGGRRRRVCEPSWARWATSILRDGLIWQWTRTRLKSQVSRTITKDEADVRRQTISHL
jgi:hypothetical protein